MSANSAMQLDPVEPVDSIAFRQALRNIAGAVSIVTSGNAPERHGLTVTAGCSLSVEPSNVLVCINKSAGAHDTIMRTKAFGWNILARDHRELARKFAGMDGSKGDERFNDDEWTDLATGAPILMDALCSFDCRVIGIHPVATHTVFIGAVVRELHRESPDGLIYQHGKFAVPKFIPEADV